MATVINIDDLALAPQEAQSLAEAIFEKKIEEGNLTTMHSESQGFSMAKKSHL